ncbi:MAG: TIR domain-containing protein [Cyanobacteria bacterium CRU_2_1]|nr:TIR domain-containing protein [Cyanobacteria bacterium CRU_2_1]
MFDQNQQLKPLLDALQQGYVNASLDAHEKHLKPKPLDIFVSYSRRDRVDFVETLCNELKKHFNIWVDWENIPVAADWRKEIREGIEAAHTFLFIVSPDSVRSLYCQDEIRHAVENNKRLISITWKDYKRDPEGNLLEDDPFQQNFYLRTLKTYNWLPFEDFDSTFQKLLVAINIDLSYVKAHAWLLLRAIEWNKQQRREAFLLRKQELADAQEWLLLGEAKEKEWIVQQETEEQSHHNQENIAKLESTFGRVKEPFPTKLHEEFITESARVERTERILKGIAIAGTATLLILLIAAVLGQVMAQRREIVALVSSLERNQGLDALVNGILAGKKLKQNPYIRPIDSIFQDSNLQVRSVTALHQGIYSLRERNRLSGHEGRIFNISFSPDGKLIASAGEDGTVRLWTDNGELVEVLGEHNNQEVVSVTFDPSSTANHYTLASASRDGKINLWKISSAKPGKLNVALMHSLNAAQTNGYALYSVVFSFGGQMLAAIGSDGTVKIWNQRDRFNQPTVLGGQNSHSGAIFSLAFSRYGDKIAIGRSNGTAEIWQREDDFKFNRLNVLTHSQNSSPELRWVISVNFSPDGQILASAGEDGIIRLWDENGSLIRSLEKHEGKVHQVIFSRDGQVLASASEDGTARLWAQDGTPLQVLRGHQAGVRRVQFSVDGRTIATAGADDTIRLWAIDRGFTHITGANHAPRQWTLNVRLITTLEGHRDEILGIAFSPNGTTFASASVDSTVRLWKLYSNPVENPVQVLPHSNRVYDVSFRPDERILATSSLQNIRLWRRDGELIQVMEGAHRTNILSVRFSSDGQWMASADAEGIVKLWKLYGTEVKLFKELVNAHPGGAYSVSFRPILSPNQQDDRILVSAGADGTIKLWNRDGTLIRTIVGHKSLVTQVSFSLDGQTFASTSTDGTIKLWDLNGNLVKTFSHETEVSEIERSILGVSFSPDGKILASAGADGTVKLWRIDGTLLQILRGHRDHVTQVRFSPDGKLIASASQDGTVKLWTNMGTELITLRGHSRSVSSVNFAHNGLSLASASYDGTAILWTLPPGFDEDSLTQLLEEGCKEVDDYLAVAQATDTEADTQTKQEIRVFCQTIRED